MNSPLKIGLFYKIDRAVVNILKVQLISFRCILMGNAPAVEGRVHILKMGQLVVFSFFHKTRAI